jgi:hypothetical protein
MINQTFEKVALDEFESESLIKLILFERSETILESSPIKEEFLSRIVIKRIEAFKLPFALTGSFMLMSMLTFVHVPGEAIMMLWLCNQMYKKHKCSLFNINIWCAMFPDGYPSKNQMDIWWLEQKDQQNQNILDKLEAWK